MCERLDGRIGAQKSAIGFLPQEGELDLTGLSVSPDDMKELMSVNTTEWRAEIPDIEAHFSTFGNRLPERLKDELSDLKARLG
jgi:phosphoenolpyruvate carboxykinase (GTP)